MNKVQFMLVALVAAIAPVVSFAQTAATAANFQHAAVTGTIGAGQTAAVAIGAFILTLTAVIAIIKFIQWLI